MANTLFCLDVEYFYDSIILSLIVVFRNKQQNAVSIGEIFHPISWPLMTPMDVEHIRREEVKSCFLNSNGWNGNKLLVIYYDCARWKLLFEYFIKLPLYYEYTTNIYRLDQIFLYTAKGKDGRRTDWYDEETSYSTI